MYVVIGGRQSGKTTCLVSWLQSQSPTFIDYVTSTPHKKDTSLLDDHGLMGKRRAFKGVSFTIPAGYWASHLVIDAIHNVTEENLLQHITLLDSIERELGLSIGVAMESSLRPEDVVLPERGWNIEWLSTPSNWPNGGKPVI